MIFFISEGQGRSGDGSVNRCSSSNSCHKQVDTTLLTFSLFGAMASSSSMKMIAGEFFSASSKAFLRLDSDSPASLLMISGPLIRKKKAPVSLATALAIRVFPVPAVTGMYNVMLCHVYVYVELLCKILPQLWNPRLQGKSEGCTMEEWERKEREMDGEKGKGRQK